jgi:putative membrane protein
MDIIINLIVSGIAIIIAAYITPGARVDSYITAIIVAVVLAIVNSTL